MHFSSFYVTSIRVTTGLVDVVGTEGKVCGTTRIEPTLEIWPRGGKTLYISQNPVLGKRGGASLIPKETLSKADTSYSLIPKETLSKADTSYWSG